MNKIKFEIQLAAFLQLGIAAKHLKPHHVSLYVCLLLKWQAQKDNPVLYVKAKEMMSQAFIGSRNVYYRYIRELHNWGYIAAYHKELHGATVIMKVLIGITSDTAISCLKDMSIEKEEDKSPVDAPTFEAVNALYKAHNVDESHAIEFYSFYSQRSWKTKNGEPVKYWKQLALKAINKLLNSKTSTDGHTGTSNYWEPV